jgi:hypothetical protein
VTPEDMHAAERARQEARHKALMAVAGAPYDPTHDLAVVLLEAWDSNPPTRTSPELAQAFANLQRSVGMASTEQAEAHLRQLLSRIDWRSHS